MQLRLHKYYDMIKGDLNLAMPVMHALNLVGEYTQNNSYNKVLLLASKFTMEDGFFAKTLADYGVESVVPNDEEIAAIHKIHLELMDNKVSESSRNYFRDLILSYKHQVDAVILGCTEFALAVDESNSALPIIDPVVLQVNSAVDFALAGDIKNSDEL